ncbi:coproporphyrinogen III oxidase [Poseidonibacter lekithochrous]|uniref:coproporphyrinogen III oxidase n=1 Tax=Poseidonibacter lekithochrous TaxID=1904463 RepID=UPI000D34C417|nr:coproporphyrinogen III oxidase [Poseidonibacter lekithochrous]
MTMIMSKENEAIEAYTLVRTLQKRFVDKLNNLSQTIGENKNFEEVTWLRDEGIHGGGSRFEARDNILFNTASVNVSQVHYDEDDTKKLQSASAISTIIHPKNPQVPSIHIHISLTKLRDGGAYWRVMADLNPSIINEEDKNIFDKAIENLADSTYEEGVKQGNKYFNIPALNRHRGVSHFYLENYKTANKEDDSTFALKFGEGVIDTYIDIITNAFKIRKEFSVQDIKAQLDYHTLYLFQVLTLDRGTTSGLLIHSQNDVGIMGSLPTFVNKKLLDSWSSKVEKPQDELVKNLAEVLNAQGCVDVKTKEKLASIVREHYKKYPEALSMQASGNTIPSTVSNHEKK